MNARSDKLRVVSHFPGRLRVRADRLRGESTVASSVAEALRATSGVSRVDHAPTTGSLLVLYDPRALPLDDLLDEIVQHAGLEGVATDPTATEILAQPDLGSRVRHGVGRIDDALRVATHDTIDLKVGFPLALGAAGVAMFFTRKRVLPQWYDLMIWSFNAFMAINQRAMIHEEIADDLGER